MPQPFRVDGGTCDPTSGSFLILAVVMIICMKALLPDEVAEKKEEMDSFGRPLSMFRDRHGVTP